MSDAQHDFEAAFVGDLLRPPGTVPRSRLAEQPGFAVYRNTVLSGCIDALAANYPAVLGLAGRESFVEAARAFALKSPPRSGVLAGYGQGFGEFLASWPGGSGTDRLFALAALDRCWTEAHLAADAPVLRAAGLAGLTARQFGCATLRPHPAARWMPARPVPVYGLWRRLREHLAPDDAPAQPGEGALFTRPAGTVLWRAAPAGAVAFLTACAAGRTFADAADAAAEAAAATDSTAGGEADDPAAWLPQLLAAGAFTRLDPGDA